MDYALRVLSWNVTKRCNLKCAHCYLGAGKPGKEELSTEEALGVIEQMGQAGTQLLILSGGEPLMRRDVFQLASHAAARGIAVVIGTNGLLMGTSTVQRLKEAGVRGVGISVDSLDASKHDAFRGVPGAWERAVRGLRRCIAAGVPALVQATAFPWNYREIPDLIEFASAEGAAGFTLYFLVCTGRGETLTDLAPEQYEEAQGWVIEGQARYPHLMVRARCAPHIIRLAHQRGSPLVSSAGCLAGTLYGRIGPEGQVTPCPYLPMQVGNVRESSLAQIWADASLLRQLRSPQLTGRCAACQFRRDCGGCRARAFATTGDLWGEDPYCSYLPGRAADVQSVAMTWEPDALERLQKVPGFIRDRVKTGVEAYAASRGYTKVDTQVLAEVLNATGRPGRPPIRPPAGARRGSLQRSPEARDRF